MPFIFSTSICTLTWMESNLPQQSAEKDPRAFIIFTTTHSEMAMTTFRYQVEPLGFLIKDDPNYTLQILHCLQSVLEKSKIPASPNGRLHFRMPDQDLFIPIHEILYIEATGCAPHHRPYDDCDLPVQRLLE